MSGIAGIVNLDGAPVDRTLVDRMAAFLAYRGPDRTGVRCQGSIGFVHTLFATTEEAKREEQPLSLDGQTWITADARIDGRKDLIRELGGHGCPCSSDATAPELILHAYAVWGEQCLDHLLGDFAFAIWDSAKRKLFCARDHFGVKPFHYARVGNSFVFGNAINCVRIPAGISQELDEQFIADFLLFEMSPDLDRTAFQAIRRLPPAHALVVTGEQVSLRRYWSLPVEPVTVYKRSRDYVEHFVELFEQAIADRLRTEQVGVLMSGGLDSTSVAATAKTVSQKTGAPVGITAHPMAYDRLVHYEEGPYARLTAEWLGIGIDYFVADSYGLFEGWEDGSLQFCEPINNPLALMGLHYLQAVARGSRVALSGFGGDPALGSLISRHCRERVQERRFGRLALDVGRFLTAEGRFSRLYLRARVKRLLGASGTKNRTRVYPEWLNPDLEKRLDLRARGRGFFTDSAPNGTVRPESYSALVGPLWPYIFEGYDAGGTTVPLEVRHPFFDLRLLRYLLTLPALPWCSDKEILRVAMKGRLPEKIRLRPKTPMAETPYQALKQNVATTIRDQFLPVPELTDFVLPERLPGTLREEETSWDAIVTALRPVSLNFWLKARSAFV